MKQIAVLKTHRCSSEELGLTGTSHSFWPVKKSYQASLNAYQNNFICVDQAELELQGGFGKESGQAIFIDLVKCSDEDEIPCKTDDEIE